MAIIFNDTAKSDILDIQDYYGSLNPEALKKIFKDIYETCEVLNIWPESGYAIDGEPGRRTTTSKYNYTVTYEIVNSDVWIMGIYRHQNRTL
jgi:plasmid stabilization system protein ParE